MEVSLHMEINMRNYGLKCCKALKRNRDFRAESQGSELGMLQTVKFWIDKMNEQPVPAKKTSKMG